MPKSFQIDFVAIISFHGLARDPNVCLVTKKPRKIEKFRHFFDVSGQMLSFNGQPELLIYLRDHSAIFPGFGDDFSTLWNEFPATGVPTIWLYMVIGKRLENKLD